MSDRVSRTIEDGVAEVRLTRPEKRNALDLAMLDALIEAGEALRDDPSVRAVVLSGEGRSFCAGIDLAVFGGVGESVAGPGSVAAGVLARRDGEVASVAQRAATVWCTVPVPVIAAVHGHAVGGGLQLALGADIRVVAPDAQLSALEIRWGLVPDMGATLVLPELVGRDVAKELVFTGRTVSGEEAVRLGLATRLSPAPREDALSLAREMAGKSPSALRAAKALLDRAGWLTVEEGLLAEQEAQWGLIGSADQLEAVSAFLERRVPRWSGGGGPVPGEGAAGPRPVEGSPDGGSL